MKKIKFIISFLIISIIMFSCNKSTTINTLEKVNKESQSPKIIAEDSDIVPEVTNITHQDNSLFGSWILISTIKGNENLTNSLLLNFYDDMTFNKKVDDGFTPRVNWRINSNSKIEVYNNANGMSSELAKIIEIKKDTIELYFENENQMLHL